MVTCIRETLLGLASSWLVEGVSLVLEASRLRFRAVRLPPFRDDWLDIRIAFKVVLICSYWSLRLG